MGIKLEQPGAAKAAAVAGAAVGEGQRAVEDRARIERQQARAIQREAQQNAQQTAMAWELRKMQLRSEQDFAQELSDRQWETDKFDRAKKWDVEKMEIRSRIDFEDEEKERRRKLDIIQNERNGYEKELREKRVDKDFYYQDAMSKLDAREMAVKMDQPYRPQDQLVEQRAASQEGRAAGAEIRAQEAHEARMADDPFKQLQRMDEVAQIIGGFSEDQEVNPKGWGREDRKRIVPLAIKDERGRWVVATAAETQLYQQAQAFRAQQGAPGSSRNTPHKPATTQEGYDAIPVGDWYMSSSGKVIQKIR